MDVTAATLDPRRSTRPTRWRLRATGSCRRSRASSTSTATRSAGRRRPRSSGSRALGETWAQRLIRGWDEGWLELPLRVGDQLGRGRPRRARRRGRGRRLDDGQPVPRRVRRARRAAGPANDRHRALGVPDRPLRRRGPGTRARPRDPLAGRRPDRGPGDRRHRGRARPGHGARHPVGGQLPIRGDRRHAGR